MDDLIRNVGQYLLDTLGLDAKAAPWSGALNLPYYLQETFTLYELQLPGLDCLLAIPRNNNAALTPVTIKKYLQQIQDKSKREAVYVQESMSPHNRKRLIEHKVSFVVPGNQLYLPLLGIDFREYFRKVRTMKTMPVSPATQVVILYALSHDIDALYTPSGLAKLLNYTPMTMTRVLNELEMVGIGEVSASGKERVLRFTEGRAALWEKALTILRSPVKKAIWTRLPGNDWRCVQAGLTALAHYSLLAEPRQSVFAISADNWKSLVLRAEAIELPDPEPETCCMEIWSYDPCLLNVTGVADPWSIYLALKEDSDERVQTALKEMMAGIV